MDVTDELEALTAVYGEDAALTGPRSACVVVRPDVPPDVVPAGSEVPPLTVCFDLPAAYPDDEPPLVEIESTWTSSARTAAVLAELRDDFSPGCPVLCEWIEWIRANALSVCPLADQELRMLPRARQPQVEEQSALPAEAVAAHTAAAPAIEILHGVPLTDRKSKFVAHLSRVHSMSEVDEMVAELKTDKRIAMATHNIVAVRITEPRGGGPVVEARDDDGEGGAGDKLLHLLKLAKVENVAVVVTRWYGGIHLGPDRFRHINNCAIALLQEHGLMKKTKK